MNKPVQATDPVTLAASIGLLFGLPVVLGVAGLIPVAWLLNLASMSGVIGVGGMAVTAKAAFYGTAVLSSISDEQERLVVDAWVRDRVAVRAVAAGGGLLGAFVFGLTYAMLAGGPAQ